MTTIEPQPTSPRRSRAALPLVLGIAAALTSAYAWVWPSLHPSTSSAAAPELGVLGRAGVTPGQIARLRVVNWDETLSFARAFEVRKEGDHWVIPSNHDYPADGNTRVSKTAAGLLGVKKNRLVSTHPEDESLGVIDPLEHDPAVKSGFGRRVTLSDATGAVVLDLIIGKRDEASSGLYFVREAGKPEVYSAKVDSDLSTKFTDYVELDPFKIAREDVRGLAVVEYQIDPDQGTLSAGSVTRVTRQGADGDWRSEQAPAGKRPAKLLVDDVLTDLAGLHLQGVRPFDLNWLEKRGFYVRNTPQFFNLPNALTVQIMGKPYALFGTEGRLDVTTRNGLRYSLMFGKVALGDDLDKDADAKAPEKKDDKDKKDDKPAETANNRYLAAFVTYDASLDEDAKAEAEQDKKDGDKKDAAKGPKKPTGRERATKAQERFQHFFYVISDGDFKKLRPEVAKLWEDMPKEPTAGNTGKTVKQWLADNGKLPGVTTTPSGLQYQVLTSGPADGPKPTTSDQVRVAYKGTLVDGTEFDANQDMRFALTGVIKAWTEALQLMKPGDQFKLFVPPELGYGEAGSPPKIGPNQILIFEVTLKEVVGKPGAAPAKVEDKKPEAPKAEEKKADAPKADDKPKVEEKKADKLP